MLRCRFSDLARSKWQGTSRDAGRSTLAPSGPAPYLQPPAHCCCDGRQPSSSGRLRDVCAKRMNLCPGIRVHVQALTIQIPCPFVISNKSSALRTQHSKKLFYFVFVFDRATFPVWQYVPSRAGSVWEKINVCAMHWEETFFPISSRMCSNHSK